jgi:hypothetical protein
MNVWHSGFPGDDTELFTARSRANFSEHDCHGPPGSFVAESAAPSETGVSPIGKPYKMEPTTAFLLSSVQKMLTTSLFASK